MKVSPSIHFVPAVRFWKNGMSGLDFEKSGSRALIFAFSPKHCAAPCPLLAQSGHWAGQDE
jgi:hypothetical protein